MKLTPYILFFFFSVAVLTVPLTSQTNASASRGTNDAPSHTVEGGFKNPDPAFKEIPFTRYVPWFIEKFTAPFSTATAETPHVSNDGSLIAQNKPYTVTWVGQSTVLIQFEGKNILTDPVWSGRLGPVSWAGAPRAVDPGIAFDKLPPIDLVIISHNHYDHFDKETLMKLAQNRATRFIVPLRLRDKLEDIGISNVQELDWWEGTTYKGIKIICTPAQHSSGRWLTDRDETLWASFVLWGKEKRLYFCGDSGYFTGFEEIGEKFGPFDLTILPIGGYEPAELMHQLYMTPEEAIRANDDLKGKTMLAVHWGTFKLTDEPIDEPPKRFREEVKARLPEQSGGQAKNLPSENYWLMMIGETREW